MTYFDIFTICNLLRKGCTQYFSLFSHPLYTLLHPSLNNKQKIQEIMSKQIIKKYKPDKLKINNNGTHCGFCNSKLKKHIEHGKILVGDECHDCWQSMRPFGKQGGCSCEYKEQDYLIIVCEKCRWHRCKMCNKKLSEVNLLNQNSTNQYCNGKYSKCKVRWIFKYGTIEDCLKLHGRRKLEKLAKLKRIPRFYCYTTKELIEILKPITLRNDFPIRL